jgi:hypothetical protein
VQNSLPSKQAPTEQQKQERRDGKGNPTGGCEGNINEEQRPGHEDRDRPVAVACPVPRLHSRARQTTDQKEAPWKIVSCTGTAINTMLSIVEYENNRVGSDQQGNR